MKNYYIGVLDSGVGGLSVLKKLTESFPFERFVYFGDNANAPYGEKSFRELLSLTIYNLSYMQPYKLKAIVLACNTLSLTVRDRLQEYLNIPVYGIFPPVEREVSKKRKTLLLATPKSCSYYKDNEFLTVFPLRLLAKEIEENLFDLSKVNVEKELPFFGVSFNTVILGCTHYEYVKKRIFNHLKPLKIIDGMDFTIEKMKNSGNFNLSGKIDRKNQVKFVGDKKILNEKFWLEVVNNL